MRTLRFDETGLFSLRRELAIGFGVLALVIGLALDTNPRGARIEVEPSAASAESRLLRRQAIETWRRLQAIAAPCDQAVEVVAELFPPISDPRGPVEPVRQASARCRSAGLQLLTLKPSAKLEVATGGDMGRALDQCQFVYTVEGNAHARLAVALDEAGHSGAPNRRVLFDAWADVQEANIDAQRCRTGFLLAARRARLPITLFETGMTGR